MVQTYRCNTHHEDVIGVWNLASSSEEFTKVVELEESSKRERMKTSTSRGGKVSLHELTYLTVDVSADSHRSGHWLNI